MPRVLSRKELTAALAERQMLIERRRLDPAEAIRLLTPLQGQDPPAPFHALAARLEGFTREDLEAAIDAGGVAKTTIMRLTLHLVATADYPAYAQLSRQARMRKWRKDHPHLDEEEVAAELREWLAEPRSNTEIRARVAEIPGVRDDTPYATVSFARTLLPLVQLSPAGHWRDPRRPRFAVHSWPLPDPDDAAALTLSRYLGAFGPASKRDVAAWSGVAQRDFRGAWEKLDTVSYEYENGTELFDLPGAPLPPANTKLPVRFLSRWDQPLLAYADRERIIPAELTELRLTLSGDATVTVDGRVAASWLFERTSGGRVRMKITPHPDIRRAARAEVRAEAERTARLREPDARGVEVAGI